MSLQWMRCILAQVLLDGLRTAVISRGTVVNAVSYVEKKSSRTFTMMEKLLYVLRVLTIAVAIYGERG